MPRVKQSANDEISENEVVFITNNPKVSNIYSVYLSQEIGDTEHYRKLFNLLRNSSPDDTFLFYINNFGGYLHSGLEIINSLKAAAGKIIAIVTGGLYSMAPLIALSADKLVMEEDTFFMFHDYSGGGSQGKGHEQLSAITHHKPHFDEMFAKINKGFLTPKEIKDVVSGKDLYIKRADVIKRLKKIGKLAA